MLVSNDPVFVYISASNKEDYTTRLSLKIIIVIMYCTLSMCEELF